MHLFATDKMHFLLNSEHFSIILFDIKYLRIIVSEQTHVNIVGVCLLLSFDAFYFVFQQERT